MTTFPIRLKYLKVTKVFGRKTLEWDLYDVYQDLRTMFIIPFFIATVNIVLIALHS